ncbi:MAG: C10 family peptidase [Rikenellaceae bacterium]|nr:C10 family peptidase [Rikenellaceae bacterium]
MNFRSNYISPETRSGTELNIETIKKHVYPSPETRSGSEEADETSVYEILFRDGETDGFAYMSGDKSFPVILAYGPEGSPDDTLYNEGLAKMLGNIQAAAASNGRPTFQLKHKDNPWQAMRPNTWDYNRIVSLPHLVGKKITRSSKSYYLIKEAMVLITKSKEIPPMITTKWNQEGSIYRQYLPYCGNAQYAYAGCGPIAVAQVIAFHRKPNTWNWNDITSVDRPHSSSYNLSASVKQQIGWYVKNVTEWPNANFECANGTWISIEDARDAFLLNGYQFNGYVGNVNWYTDWIKILNSIDARRPVIMGAKNNQGRGHMFILDGYIEEKYELWFTAELFQNSRSYGNYFIGPNEKFSTWFYSINWGNGGSADGYYNINCSPDYENSSLKNHYMNDYKALVNMR